MTEKSSLDDHIKNFYVEVHKMKKIVAILMALALVFCLAACGGNTNENGNDTTKAGNADENEQVTFAPVAKEDIKVGFIFLHDEMTRTSLTLQKLLAKISV